MVELDDPVVERLLGDVRRVGLPAVLDQPDDVEHALGRGRHAGLVVDLVDEDALPVEVHREGAGSGAGVGAGEGSGVRRAGWPAAAPAVGSIGPGVRGRPIAGPAARSRAPGR